MDTLTTARVRHVSCPVCGAEVPVSGIGGRKPLAIPVTIVYDALRDTSNVRDAADKLKERGFQCGPAYIYKVLKSQGVTLADVLSMEEKVGETAKR